MAVCLVQQPQEAPGTPVHGFRGDSYVVVEGIFSSVGSQKGSVPLGWDTNPLRDCTARHVPSVCYMQQTPSQTCFLQKLLSSSPFTLHSITRVVQSHLIPPHTSWHPCVLPKWGSYTSWEALPGSPKVCLGKNVKILMITIITSSCGTMWSIREPSKVIQEEHIRTAAQEGFVCVSHAQPHRMNKMSFACNFVDQGGMKSLSRMPHISKN